MKNQLIHKLTIVIEATNFKNLSSEVLKTIQSFEKSISSNQGLQIS